ncbi:MAG: peptide cleavage/export ABC transporter [Firmicutes bacterium]|nr:peptide cleavage/export ABC transporter [Bacillota bacterium]
MSKFKFVKHTGGVGKDSTAAVIATVLMQYGHAEGLKTLKSIGVTENTPLGISNTFDKLGFKSKVWDFTKEMFQSEFPLPAIAGITTKKGLSFYVVIHKIDRKGKKPTRFLIADPAVGLVRVSAKEFFSFFDGTIVMCTPKEGIAVSRPAGSDAGGSVIGDVLGAAFFPVVVAGKIVTGLGRSILSRDRGWFGTKKYKIVRQHDIADCGAAVIATICLHYGKETTITRLRDLSGTDIRGTTALGIVNTLHKLGFEAKAWKLTRDGFKETFTLPVIARIITKEGLAHFIVIHEIYKKGGKITGFMIADPAKGLLKQSAEEFFEEFDGNLILCAPTTDFVADKIKTGSVFNRFSRLVFAQKRLFVLAIIGSIILTVLGIAGAFFNRMLMDEILPFGLRNQLLLLCIAFGIMGLFKILLGAAREHLLVHLSLKIDIPLMLGYFKHIFGLPMKFFGTRRTGDILTRFQDAGTITAIFTQVTLSLVIDLMLIVISGIILYIMNSTLFFIIVAITISKAILVYAFLRPYKQLNIESMEKQAAMSSQTIDSLRAVETIKSFGVEEEILEQLENRFIQTVRVGYRGSILQNIQGSIGGVVNQVGNLALMGIAALSVMNGDITLGSKMAFMSLSGYFMGPVERLVGLQIQIQEAQIAMKRISELYDLDEEQPDKDHLITDFCLKGDIEIKNITFRYGGRAPVLNDVSTRFKMGEKVAIVGQSGGGKTTLAKLVLGLWEPEEGSVLINSYNIEELDKKLLRRRMAYVPQNVELFSGTVSDNIKLGKREATYEEIKRAAERAGCADFIEKLPAKYGTFLEEAGANLSGGERQRLALARALIKEPEILILDEATSALDFVAENQVYKTLFSLQCTVLVVAHRLSTIRRCDRVVVVDSSKIAEEGTHDELLAKGGVYYQIWTSQMGAEKPQDTLGDGFTSGSGRPGLTGGFGDDDFSPTSFDFSPTTTTENVPAPLPAGSSSIDDDDDMSYG